MTSFEPRSRGVARVSGLGFIAALLVFSGVGFSGQSALAADVQVTIDFDVQNLPTGTVVSEIQADAGGGDVAGPVAVHGTLPGTSGNRAILFDSALRTGGDADLGTPNIDFGGPGIGSGGSAGSPAQNDQEQFNILIVAEDMVDANNDGLIDDPDDAAVFGMILAFDFRTIQSPFVPAAVTVQSITTIDGNLGNTGEVRVYDDNDVLISTTVLTPGGNNGLVTQGIGPGGAGVYGAARMEVQLNGSAGIDDIEIELHSGPPPTCDISETGPLSVAVGQEVCFDVTGAATSPSDPVCNPSGSCAPLLTPPTSCSQSANAHWDFTGCLAFGHNTNFSEFVPTITESCSGVSVSATVVEQTNGQHSCNSDVISGAGGGAMCVPVRTGANYDHADTNRTTRFDVTVTETEGKTATLEVFSFYHSAAYTVSQHQTGGSPISYSNDPNELYGLKVLRDGVQIFFIDDVATSTSWVETQYSFAGDPQFQVTSGSAVFTFELQGYAASGSSADLRVWDLDEFDVSICCGEPEACPQTVVLDATSIPTGATATPTLPADSTPASSVTSTICWTPTAADIGSNVFSFAVTDCKGEFTTCEVEVVVTCTLEFAPGGQPDSLDLCAGSTASFLVNANDNPAATVQWFFNGTPIPGATNELLELIDIQPSDAGSYTAVFTSACGTITSDPATLTVKTAPSLDLDSTPISRCIGESATLSATATGTAPITYSWTLNGAPLGETSATLVINPVGLADAGTYEVTATNECGDATDSVVLTVLTPPSITAQPMGATVCEGDPATLMVTASGSSPLTYQWFLDGTPVGGATSATLFIPAAGLGNAGTYTVVVTNSCSSATSGPAVLVVRTAPQITAQPQGVTQCEGTTVTLTVTASGSEPLSYSWSKDGLPVPGNMATLTIPNATPADSGSYTATVTNDCGSDTSTAAVVAVLEGPEITAQPQDATVCEGELLSLSVTATGSAPLSYQWFLGGAPIPGATMSTYSVAVAGLGDAGSYTVTVSNTCDTVTSTPALVTVRTAPAITAQPQNATDCVGATIVLTFTASGSAPLTISWSQNGTPIPGANMTTLTITDADAGDAGNYAATVTNDCGTATTDVAVVTILEPPVITAQPQGAVLCEGDTLMLSVTATGSAPLSYQWFFMGNPLASQTNSALMIPNVTTANAGSYTVTVSNDCGSANSDAAIVDVRTAPMITLDPVDTNVCLGTTLTLTAMATGSTPLSYQWRLNGANLPSQTSATLTIPSVVAGDAGSYDVVVTNDCDSATSSAAIVVVDEPRTVTVPPQSQTVCEGAPVTFTATVAGTAPLTFQWKKDGIPIPGANSATLTIPSATTDAAGVYELMITNDCGNATSAPATLTVEVAPVIVTDPMSAALCLGTPLVLSVTASGTAPLSYVWSQNSVPIPNSDSPTLDLGALDLADEGMYTVTVTNNCGSATSGAAIVDVLQPRTVTVDPVPQDLCEGDTLTLTVVVSGTDPITLQWRLDGVPIPGANMSTYTVPSVDTGDAGSYTVFVSNDCGDATSGAALVTVGVAPTVTLTSSPTVEGCLMSSTTLTATVTGTAPITLQWQQDGANIPGAHDLTFTIPSLMASDAGTYKLVATNDCGMDMSGDVTITVLTPPVITLQPEGGEFCPDEMLSTTLTVQATGSPVLLYEWFLDGVAIPNSDSESLAISDIMTDNYGSYTVVVTNDCGSATSDAAVLSEPPAGDCEIIFERGDCNADGLLNIADAIYIMRFMFQGFAPPSCLDPCDFNDDGVVDISDAIYAVTYIFSGGAAPPNPFGACDVDPTADNLPCDEFEVCDVN